eukprot:9235379-Ditylum_brightwellii.AAC.1
MITTVLEKAPKEYGTVLTCKQRNKGAHLTMKDLHEAMMQLSRRLYGQDEIEDGQNEGTRDSSVPTIGARQRMEIVKSAIDVVKTITPQKNSSKTPTMHIRYLSGGEKEMEKETTKRK